MVRRDINLAPGTRISRTNPADVNKALHDIDKNIRTTLEIAKDTYSVEDTDRMNLDFDHIPARIHRDAVQVIVDSTSTSVMFDTELFDTYEYWNVAQADRITFLIGGVYLIRAQVEWESNGTGVRKLDLNKPGAPAIIIGNNTKPAGVTAPFMLTQEVTTFYDFAAGEFVNVKAYQNSGGDLDIVAARVEVMRISPSSKPRAGIRGFAK